MQPRRVVIVDPSPGLADLLAGPPLEVDHVRGPEDGLAELLGGAHDVAVVAEAAGGADLIARAVERGCATPILLAALDPGRVHAAALWAGAVGVLDPEADRAEACRVLDFAHAVHVQHGAFLREIGSSLTHEGKNALAAIGGALQVVTERLGADSPEREVLREVQARLAAFSRTIDALTLMLAARDLGRGPPGEQNSPQPGENHAFPRRPPG